MAFLRKIFAVAPLCVASACMSVGREDGAEMAAPMRSAPVFLETDILGLDTEALDKLLGPAALVRREGAGQFRRYALARCELIVIVYPDETGRAAARRLDAASRMSDAGKPSVSDCLAGGLAAPVS